MKRILALLSLLIWVSSNAQNSSIHSSAIDSILNSYCQPDQPGMAVGIVKNGSVVYKNAVGIADLSNGLPITDSTAFNLASVSKHFTGLLAIMAEEEGMLSLDDDIKKYLPELEAIPQKITIEQLANHSHGLPNYSEISTLMGFTGQDPLSNAYGVDVMLRTKQTNFEPGTKFQYGNSGFMLLAEILKRVYEKPFPEIAQEKLFGPLDMSQSVVVDHPNNIVTNKARPYTRYGNGFEELASRQMECGSSNVFSSLNDMIKWMINFQNPTVGSTEHMARLSEKTIALIDNGEVDYGLGLFTENYKGVQTIFHGGGAAGYRAYIIHAPEHQLSIITLGNLEGFEGILLVQELLEEYLGENLKEATPKKTSYTAEELNEFAGTYEFHPGQYWTIVSDGENLFFEGDNTPLPSIGDNRFGLYFIPTAHITFRSNEMLVRVVDFIYSCEKVELNPPDLEEKDLEKYVGVYQNEEYQVFYEIVEVEGSLVAKHFMNGDLTLRAKSTSSFYASEPHMGVLDFDIDKDGIVKGFHLSAQNMANIAFTKL